MRLTRDEFERLKNNCRAKGYKNMSAYMRNMCLGGFEQELLAQQKISEIHAKSLEIHAHLLGNSKDRKFKKSRTLKSSG